MSPGADTRLTEIARTTQPTAAEGRGYWSALYRFARRLKAIPYFAAADNAELQAALAAWHGPAMDALGGKPLADVYLDFLHAWERVGDGADTLQRVLDLAQQSPLPETVLPELSAPTFRLLIALCRELQRQAGGEPFYLGCRDAGRLIGVNHNQASRWLSLLVGRKVLTLVKKGLKPKASEYRYLLPLGGAQAFEYGEPDDGPYRESY